GLAPRQRVTFGLTKRHPRHRRIVARPEAEDHVTREAVEAELRHGRRQASTMTAAVCCGFVQQAEDAPSEEVGVVLFARGRRGGPPAGVGGAGCGIGRAAGGGHDERDRHHAYSIANSRQKTTSKLKVLAVRRVSMTSAMRVSLAGIPRIFSCAFLPISLRPSMVSIFQ